MSVEFTARFRLPDFAGIAQAIAGSPRWHPLRTSPPWIVHPTTTTGDPTWWGVAPHTTTLPTVEIPMAVPADPVFPQIMPTVSPFKFEPSFVPVPADVAHRLFGPTPFSHLKRGQIGYFSRRDVVAAAGAP